MRFELIVFHLDLEVESSSSTLRTTIRSTGDSVMERLRKRRGDVSHFEEQPRAVHAMRVKVGRLRSAVTNFRRVKVRGDGGSKRKRNPIIFDGYNVMCRM